MRGSLPPGVPFPCSSGRLAPHQPPAGGSFSPEGEAKGFFHLVKLWAPVPLAFHQAPAST